MHPDLDRVSSTDSRDEDVARRLRALPSELAPPFDWAEFRRREHERSERSERSGRSGRSGQGWSSVKWQHATAVAGITLLIAGMAMWARSTQHAASTSPSVTAMSPRSALPDNGDPARTRALGAQTAAARAAASQRWLARQPEEPAVVRVGPRLAVANLEDRIAWVDDALTDEQFGPVDATRMQALQHERARLMNSLVQVRYAEALVARAQ